MSIKSQGTTLHISNEDADSTPYGSATFSKIGEVTSIGEPDGEAADIDTTHLESEAKEYLIGLPDNGNMAIAMNAIEDDVGHERVITAKETQVRCWLKIIWSSGSVWYIKVLAKKYNWSAGVDAKIEATSSFRTSGAWTRV